jgi:hypothetical protein
LKKKLVSGYFSSIPMATLIAATLDADEENEVVDDGSLAGRRDSENTKV